LILKGDSYGQELLDLIPHEQLRGFPRLGLCRVYLDFKQGLLDEARLLMAELAGRTENFTVDRPGGDALKLKTEALCVSLIIDFYGRSHAPMEYLRSIEQEQLPIVSKGDSILVTLVRLILGALYTLRGDLEAAQTHFIQCEKLNARERSPWMMVWLKYHNGMIALARGHLTEARYNLQAGLKLWTAQFRTLSGLPRHGATGAGGNRLRDRRAPRGSNPARRVTLHGRARGGLVRAVCRRL